MIIGVGIARKKSDILTRAANSPAERGSVKYEEADEDNYGKEPDP